MKKMWCEIMLLDLMAMFLKTPTYTDSCIYTPCLWIFHLHLIQLKMIHVSVLEQMLQCHLLLLPAPELHRGVLPLWFYLLITLMNADLTHVMFLILHLLMIQ